MPNDDRWLRLTIAFKYKFPYDEQCGLCSGIPSCCVRFFITTWKHNPSKEHLVRCRGYRYIACPDCISSGHKVQIARCFPACSIHRRRRCQQSQKPARSSRHAS